MKKAFLGKTFSIAVIGLVMLAGSAQAIAPPACVPFTGPNIVAPGIRLVYQASGQTIVQHDLKGAGEGDKFVVESSIPVVENGVVVRYRTYTQQIHAVSRQVIWTSEPVTNRSLPGVLPQSDYTDLWIPPATLVGSFVTIQNQTLPVGAADAGHLSVGSRIYDRTTGVLTGVTAPAPGITLAPVLQCETGSIPPPPPPPAPVLAVSATTSLTAIIQTETSILATVRNNGGAINNPIIDLEIYRQNGQLAFQQFIEMNEPLAASSSRNFTFRWTPQEAGQYIGKLGIFTSGWGNLLLWSNDLIPAFTVNPGTPPPVLGDVVMSQAFVTSTPYYLSERAVLHALFTSPVPPSQPVLLDLELYNAQNQKIAQSFFDNITVTSTESLEKILDVPRYLPKGTYTFKVGIFNPGWNGLVRWYDNAATFALAELGQYEDEDVRMSFVLADPSVIQTGQSSTLLASFVSPNTQNHMFLDLELVNSQGAIVAEEERDNLSINRSGIGNYENIYTLSAPNTLPPGTYAFSVGIYTLGKASLIRAYPNAATLTVQ